MAWRVIEACSGQVRATDGGVFALDFPAVLTFAALLGADIEFVAEILPIIEPAIVCAWRREED